MLPDNLGLNKHCFLWPSLIVWHILLDSWLQHELWKRVSDPSDTIKVLTGPDSSFLPASLPPPIQLNMNMKKRSVEIFWHTLSSEMAKRQGSLYQALLVSCLFLLLPSLGCSFLPSILWMTVWQEAAEPAEEMGARQISQKKRPQFHGL